MLSFVLNDVADGPTLRRMDAEQARVWELEQVWIAVRVIATALDGLARDRPDDADIDAARRRAWDHVAELDGLARQRFLRLVHSRTPFQNSQGS